MTEEIKEKPTKGQYIAAYLFIVNAVMNFVVVFSGLDTENLGMIIGPSAVDIMIAVAILKGNKSLVGFAIFRVVMGMLFAGRYLKDEDYVSIGLQAIMTFTFLMLLIGKPKKIRLGFSYAGMGILAIFYFVNLQQIFTGTNYLNQIIASIIYKSKDIKNGQVFNSDFEYKINSVSDFWKSRIKEDFKKDNPLADKWLINSKYDAHIIVLAEKLDPSMTIQHDLFLENVKKNYQSIPSTSILNENSNLIMNHNSTNLEFKTTINQMALHYKVGVFSKNNIGIQVIGFCPEQVFTKLKPEFEKVISSFEFYVPGQKI